MQFCKSALAMRLLLLFGLLASVAIQVKGGPWVPRDRVIGWGADRHAPALRIKESDRDKPARERPEWIQWRTTVGGNRSYHNVTHEELHARIFEESEMIVTENKIAFERGQASYTLALNKFADFTEEQVGLMGGMDEGKYIDKKYFANASQMHSDMTYSTNNKDDDPDCELRTDELLDFGAKQLEFNWNQSIEFNPVKDQGYCGSCYAFAAIATIEAQIYITKHEKYSLSEQYAMDCSRNYRNAQMGCGGGLSSRTYDWFLQNRRGFALDSSYRYTERSSDECPARGAKAEFFKIKCYRRFEEWNERLLNHYVFQMGPIATGLFAGGPNFHIYKSGIYDIPFQNCNSKVNHEVVTIGWSYVNGTSYDMNPYWIIRNSWGTGWGMDGYFYLRRFGNLCGFPFHISFPKIQSCSPTSDECIPESN